MTTMKNLTWVVGITIIVIALILGSASVSAQGTCGNCDGDTDGEGGYGLVDIADLTCLIGYLYLDYPIFGNYEDIDIDDYEGVTSRDLVFLTDNIGGQTFSPFFCPTSNPPLVPIPDSSFLVEYQNTIQPGDTKMEIPIYLTISNVLNIVQLPFRLRIGELIPKIDSIQFPFSWHNIGRVDTANGELALFVYHVFSSPIKPLEVGKKNHLASVFVSFHPSAAERTLTVDWTTLSPIQAPTPDSSIMPALFFTREDGAGVFAPSKRSYICGDVDFSGGLPDIADLTFLIDHLFINFPPLVTTLSGNIDGVGGVDISDLTLLIDHLFINFPKIGC